MHSKSWIMLNKNMKQRQMLSSKSLRYLLPKKPWSLETYRCHLLIYRYLILFLYSIFSYCIVPPFSLTLPRDRSRHGVALRKNFEAPRSPVLHQCMLLHHLRPFPHTELLHTEPPPYRLPIHQTHSLRLILERKRGKWLEFN